MFEGHPLLSAIKFSNGGRSLISEDITMENFEVSLLPMVPFRYLCKLLFEIAFSWLCTNFEIR